MKIGGVDSSPLKLQRNTCMCLVAQELLCS